MTQKYICLTHFLVIDIIGHIFSTRSISDNFIISNEFKLFSHIKKMLEEREYEFIMDVNDLCTRKSVHVHLIYADFSWSITSLVGNEFFSWVSILFNDVLWNPSMPFIKSFWVFSCWITKIKNKFYYVNVLKIYMQHTLKKYKSTFN